MYPTFQEEELTKSLYMYSLKINLEYCDSNVQYVYMFSYIIVALKSWSLLCCSPQVE